MPFRTHPPQELSLDLRSTINNARTITGANSSTIAIANCSSATPASVQHALAPLAALRRVSSLSLVPESGLLSDALATALSCRLTSLRLEGVSGPGAQQRMAAVARLTRLGLGLEAAGVGGGWVAPLVALGGTLREVEVTSSVFHLRGAELQVCVRWGGWVMCRVCVERV